MTCRLDFRRLISAVGIDTQHYTRSPSVLWSLIFEVDPQFALNLAASKVKRRDSVLRFARGVTVDIEHAELVVQAETSYSHCAPMPGLLHFILSISEYFQLGVCCYRASRLDGSERLGSILRRHGIRW